MNNEVIDAYVDSEIFRSLIFSWYLEGNMHYVHCQDNDGNTFLLYSIIGDRAKNILSAERPAANCYEKIEKYIVKNYSAEQLAFVVFAIIYGVSDEKLSLLTLRKNNLIAELLLDALLCGTELNLLKEIVNSKSSIKKKQKQLSDIIPDCTLELENTLTKEKLSIKRTSVKDDDGESFAISFDNQCFSLRY